MWFGLHPGCKVLIEVSEGYVPEQAPSNDVKDAPKEKKDGGPRTAAIGVVGAAIVAAVAAIVVAVINKPPSPNPPGVTTSPTSSAGVIADPPAITSPGGGTPSPSKVAAGKLFAETGGNRGGSPLFGDAHGAAVPDGKPASVPYGETVQVSCRVKNTTAMSSVSYFYKIEGPGKYAGTYGVSDTFLNGDQPGTRGSHNVDEAVPVCTS